MRKVLTLITASLLATSCTIVSVKDLDETNYRVTSFGNIFHSRETLEKDIVEEAEELCGKNAFTIDAPATVQKQRYLVGAAPSGSNMLTQTITCTESAT